MVKHLPAMWETRLRFLGREDPLEKEMAIHSSILAWKIPWTQKPDRLQSMGLQRVGHDWETSLQPVGQIHVRGCFCTACKLRRVFTFLNGWKKKTQKITPRHAKILQLSKFSVGIYMCVSEHSHTHFLVCCLWLCTPYNDRVVVTETTRPKVKLCTIWPFPENMRLPRP